MSISHRAVAADKVKNQGTYEHIYNATCNLRTDLTVSSVDLTLLNRF